MSVIPDNYQGSPALQFVLTRGWDWKPTSAPNIELEKCPYCDKAGYGHFYMEVHGTIDPDKRRDGLHTCHRCGKSGNLYSLKEHLGIVIPGVESRKEWSASDKETEPLPDVAACHEALLEDEDALDYLMNGRGFSMEIIQRQKIGLLPKRYFRETGEVRAIVYPYLVNGNCVFAHYRTLPTMPLAETKVPKAFSSPKGWDVPLYNGEILRPGLKDIILVEGEANVIAALDHGVTDICGVPGANVKKAEWIDTLDKLDLERIYICYDADKVGQRAAQALASRIGVERCWKLNLPYFLYDGEGGPKQGKDLNEWFAFGGGTADAFERLKQEADLFDVDGVCNTSDALDALYEQLEGHGVEPTYKAGPWPSLQKYVGFNDGDVIDILAPEKIGKTTFGMNLMEYQVDTTGDDGIIVCLEMTREQLARKWVCHKRGIADNIPENPEQAKKLTEEFLREIPLAKQEAANRKGDLYWCLPRYRTTEDIYKLMVDCIRRYGVKWVMLDNVQRMADTTPRGNRSRTEHLSEISKRLSQIAKEYNIQMVRILQPHRIGNGDMVTSDNVDGSSQIAKDCDCMITLHRNKVNQMSQQTFEASQYVESQTSFDEKMLVTVALSRYSSGGYTTLHYDGARSTVIEIDDVQKHRMAEVANMNIGYNAEKLALGIPNTQPRTEAVLLL